MKWGLLCCDHMSFEAPRPAQVQTRKVPAVSCGIEEPIDTAMTSASQCKEVGQSCSYIYIRSHSFSTCTWWSFSLVFWSLLQPQAVYASFTPTYWTVQMITLSGPNIWEQITFGVIYITKIALNLWWSTNSMTNLIWSVYILDFILP